jgi:hypothetical protein
MALRRVRGAGKAPFFPPLSRGQGGAEPSGAGEPGSRARRTAIIGEGTAYRAIIAAAHPRVGIGAALELALQGAHALHVLFACFLGLPLRFIEGVGGCTQVMAVPKLMRDVGEGALHRRADRGLPIAADRHTRDRAGCFDLVEKGRPIVGGADKSL